MSDFKQIATGTIGIAKKYKKTSPDFNGSITFDHPVPVGAKLMIGAWKRSTDDGGEFIAFTISEDLRRPSAEPAKLPEGKKYNPTDDDEPF